MRTKRRLHTVGHVRLELKARIFLGSAASLHAFRSGSYHCADGAHMLKAAGIVSDRQERPSLYDGTLLAGAESQVTIPLSAKALSLHGHFRAQHFRSRGTRARSSKTSPR